MTFESVRETARRRNLTITRIYQRLAEGREPGAIKIDGKWRIPVPPSSTPPCVTDFKAAAAGDHDE